MPLIEINKKRGVVLLYAVLMVSIVLTISLSLLNITYKQIVLTAVSRESQVAHFNTLSALDCIYFTDRSFKDSSYNDTANNPFGQFGFSETGVTLNAPVGNPASFSCGGVGVGQITATTDVGGAPGAPGGLPGTSATGILSRYKMSGPGLGGSCSTVTVVKVLSGDYKDFGEGSGIIDNGKVMTTSLGYNTCDINSSRLVERRARVRL